MTATQIISQDHFNPPTPCGVGPTDSTTGTISRANFNPPTPCGVGPHKLVNHAGTLNFNPPTPCGVGRCIGYNVEVAQQFQSTHPVWGGTPLARYIVPSPHISIHPPRVGWDGIVKKSTLLNTNFNPPTPCGVGLKRQAKKSKKARFQSTHPVWGGTRFFCDYWRCWLYFNPPTPCGVGQSL